MSRLAFNASRDEACVISHLKKKNQEIKCPETGALNVLVIQRERFTSFLNIKKKNNE